MHAAEAAEVAEPRPVEGDHVAEVGWVVDVDAEVVAAVLGVGYRPVVPVGAVEPEVLRFGLGWHAVNPRATQERRAT